MFGVDDQVTAGAQPEARAGELDVRAATVWTPGREVIQSRVDIEPDSPPIRHTHPGEEIIYVLEGSLEYQIGGQPTKVYNAGEALTVRPGQSTRCATSAPEPAPHSLPTSWRRASRSSPWPSKRPAGSRRAP